MKKKPVLVLDTHRGVYFGYVGKVDDDPAVVKLTDARHVFYWEATGDKENSGVYALATVGPDPGSKVGPRVTMTIRDISKIVECVPEAVEKWEASKWGR